MPWFHSKSSNVFTYHLEQNSKSFHWPIRPWPYCGTDYPSNSSTLLHLLSLLQPQWPSWWPVNIPIILLLLLLWTYCSLKSSSSRYLHGPLLESFRSLLSVTLSMMSTLTTRVKIATSSHLWHFLFLLISLNFFFITLTTVSHSAYLLIYLFNDCASSWKLLIWKKLFCSPLYP